VGEHRASTFFHSRCVSRFVDVTSTLAVAPSQQTRHYYICRQHYDPTQHRRREPLSVVNSYRPVLIYFSVLRAAFLSFIPCSPP